MSSFSLQFLIEADRHGVSKMAAQSIYSLILKNFDTIKNTPVHTCPLTVATLRKRALKSAPEPSLHVKYTLVKSTEKKPPKRTQPHQKPKRSKVTTEIVETKEAYGLKQLSRDFVPKYKGEDTSMSWILNFEIWTISVKELLDFHNDIHKATGLEDAGKNIHVGVDGVSPKGPSTRTQMVVSLRFETCQHTYIIAHGYPGRNEYKAIKDAKLLLGKPLEEIRDLGLTITLLSSDGPMRGDLRKQKSHSSAIGCDYCCTKGKHLKATKELEDGKWKKEWGTSSFKMSYPNGMPGSEILRSTSKMKSDIQQLMRNRKRVEVNKTKKKKTDMKIETEHINGYCDQPIILSLLPDFDIINKMPVDPMHLLYGPGVTGRLALLTFHEEKQESRVSRSKDPLIEVAKLKSKMPEVVQLPTEIPRSFKSENVMKLSKFKASEWRTFLIVIFPLVIEALPLGPTRRLWAMLSYMIRAYNLPPEAYDAFVKKRGPQYLKCMAKAWLRVFEKIFTEYNMSYNVHLMSHLDLIREQGPFYAISAFTFEGSYASITKGQHLGAASVGKSAIKDNLQRAAFRHRHAEKELKLSVNATQLRNDSLVYTFKDETYTFYQITAIDEEEIEAKKFIKSSYRILGDCRPDATQYNFLDVGVAYVTKEAEGETCKIKKSDISGKFVKIQVGRRHVAVSLCKGILRECT